MHTMLARRAINGPILHANRHPAFHNAHCRVKISRTRCFSQSEEGPGPAQQPEKNEEDKKMKRTLSDLNALLGITDEEPKAKEEKQSTSAPEAEDPVTISISPEALAKLMNADSARSGQPAVKSPPSQTQSQIDEQFQRIIEKAKKLASDDSASLDPESQKAIKKEFSTLVETVFSGQTSVDKEDVKKLKEAACGPLSFWVTEIIALPDLDRPGFLIRGNLRDDLEKVFDLLCAKNVELFGEKYEILMVEDLDQSDDPTSIASPKGPRVAFQLVPKNLAQPPVLGNVVSFFAVILSLACLFTCGQLALAASITKLPPETLAFFSNPDNFNTDAVAPGLEDWDPTAYFNSAAPLLLATIGINATHEIGHRIAAAVKGVKLGPSVFIPFQQIGTFGAITPFASLLKNHKQMWDVAAAGPLAGFSAALAVFCVGLSMSHPGAVPEDVLVPVPTQLFQGSFLLGLITKLSVGEAAMRSQQIFIHPFVIAGWCGLVTTALNMLPVGQVDGGRMLQASYGKQALALSSFFTYLGLGLGLLGSNLAFPFGLYVAICQRTAEKYIQDTVTPAGDARQIATAIAVFTAILILVPLAPEAADTLGVGPAPF